MLVDKYVTRSTEEFRTSPPSRALLLLDLENMFNSVSRKCSRDQLLEKLPHLVRYFDLLHEQAQKCWYLKPDGDWGWLRQVEGFPQGCPLSVIFSCLVLHQILIILDSELRLRAASRLDEGDVGDDGMGSITDIFAFLDDTNATIPYDDLLFFFQRFAELGAPLGCRLTPHKCKILTSTNSTSPSHHLPARHRQILKQALNDFCGGAEGELVSGTRLLGCPIGSSAFATSFHLDAVRRLNEATSLLIKRIADPQICFQIYKACIQPMVAHLELTDTLHTPPAQIEPSTVTLKTMDNLYHFVSQIIYGRDSKHTLPYLSQILAIRPVGQGGLGLRSTQDSRVGRLVVPTCRSIRFALQGLTFRGTPSDEDHPAPSIILPPSIQHLYSDWKTGSQRLFTALRTLGQRLHDYPRFRDSDVDNHRQNLVLQEPLGGFARNIYRQSIQTKLTSIWSDLSPSDRAAIPSLSCSLTPLVLAHMTRRIPSNRLQTSDTRFLIKRILRLPVFIGASPTCPCGLVPFDPMADHMFSCKSFHKSDGHNKIRDGLFEVCKAVVPLIESIGDAQVWKERTSTIPLAPRMRPGDVSIHYGDTSDSPHAALLIDVTTLGHAPSSTDIVVFQPVTASVLQHHITSEDSKFRSKECRGGHIYLSPEQVMEKINEHQYQFLPFTVDCGGLLGPLATDFLFGRDASRYPKHSYSARLETSKIHTAGQVALARSLGHDRLSGILPEADRSWIEKYGRTKWFTSGYQAMLPSQWAKQTLGLAIVRAHLAILQKAQKFVSKTSAESDFECCRYSETNDPESFADPENVSPSLA
ncbi:MAG: hypothetical protein ACREOZ_04970 [Gloeomargaritales cyanobacterium]